MIPDRRVEDDRFSLWIECGVNDEAWPRVNLGLPAGLEVTYHDAIVARAGAEVEDALADSVEREAAMRAEFGLGVA